MAGGFPAISGNELIKVLTKKCVCKEAGKRTHGVAITRNDGDRTRIAIVPTKDDSLPKGTLGAILREIGISKDDLKEFL